MRIKTHYDTLRQFSQSQPERFQNEELAIGEGAAGCLFVLRLNPAQSQVTTKTTLIGKHPGRNLSLMWEPLSVGNVTRNTHYVKILATQDS